MIQGGSTGHCRGQNSHTAAQHAHHACTTGFARRLQQLIDSSRGVQRCSCGDLCTLELPSLSVEKCMGINTAEACKLVVLSLSLSILWQSDASCTHN